MRHSRSNFTAATLLLVGVSVAFSGNCQKNTVLFVCEHGSAKSVIAAVYFNKLAKERNLPWEANTKGINPESTLSRNTEQGLKSDHLLEGNIIPAKVSQKDLDEAAQIVLFFPLPQNLQPPPETKTWSNLPPVSEDYGRARDAIILKVQALLDSLSKK